MNHKPTFLFLVITVICTMSANAQSTQASGGRSEADIKAFAHMRDYVEWKQFPASVLAMCKKMDPAGIESRETAYAAWATAHQAVFTQFDAAIDKILPRLAPASSQTSLRPSVFFANHTDAKAIIGLASISQEKKSDMCATYAKLLVPLGEPTRVKEVGTFLQDLAQNPSSGSQGK